MSERDPVLAVRALSVDIGVENPIRPVDAVDIDISRGQTHALLGESGCGKSMTALAIMRLLPAAGRIVQGTVRYADEDILALPEARMRSVRGGGMAMIFQEPATSLNPVMTVFRQIEEVLGRHRGLSGAPARAEAARLLSAVGVSDAVRRLDDYPFQFSGGMKQRVMIAMALAGEPELLIADEPTTALDVTLQAQVLDMLDRLQRDRAMAMLLITHDLGVVARMAHRVSVMYAGEIVETGVRDRFFASPLHPYSRKLFAALPRAGVRDAALETLPGMVPRLDQRFSGCRFADRCPEVLEICAGTIPAWHDVDGRKVRCHLYADDVSQVAGERSAAPQIQTVQSSPREDKPLLVAQDLQVHFPIHKGVLKRVVAHVRAVDGIDLALTPGRTLALVGESGCGKTTVGKALMQLIPPTGGSVKLDGVEQIGLRGHALHSLRRDVQMVFQDPFASLNPRMRVGEVIEEGMAALRVGGDRAARHKLINGLLEKVGLSQATRGRFPHAFSGGQRQRVALARALAVSPRVIVCDEPTSALDVSVQAQILNLMRDLQRAEGIAYLFITHNIAVVDYLAHDVAVMYLGRIVEQGSADNVLRDPQHPYTRMLLAAVLTTDVSHENERPAPVIEEIELPSAISPPSGCHFHPRCELADDRCRREYPPQTPLGGGAYVRCHRVAEAREENAAVASAQ